MIKLVIYIMNINKNIIFVIPIMIKGVYNMQEMLHPAEELCRIMERIYDVEMTSLTGGNASIMDNEGVMWVTPTSIDKKSLTREDIVKILPDGTVEGKHKPT